MRLLLKKAREKYIFGVRKMREVYLRWVMKVWRARSSSSGRGGGRRRRGEEEEEEEEDWEERDCGVLYGLKYEKG